MTKARELEVRYWLSQFASIDRWMVQVRGTGACLLTSTGSHILRDTVPGFARFRFRRSPPPAQSPDRRVARCCLSGFPWICLFAAKREAGARTHTWAEELEVYSRLPGSDWSCLRTTPRVSHRRADCRLAAFIRHRWQTAHAHIPTVCKRTIARIYACTNIRVRLRSRAGGDYKYKMSRSTLGLVTDFPTNSSVDFSWAKTQRRHLSNV